MKHYLFLTVVAITATIQGCYPEGPEYSSDMDIAITTYEASTDFSQFSTYTLPDTIVYFDNKTTTSLGHKFDSSILNLIAAEFDSLGYTQIDTNGGVIPTFIVTVSAFSQEDYSYYMDNWGNNWGWYWGSLWPGYNFYPDYDWIPYGYYSYQNGSIVIDMINAINITTNESTGSKNLNVVWNGTVSGILDGTPTALLNRITNKIEQCFKQSKPYLSIQNN